MTPDRHLSSLSIQQAVTKNTLTQFVYNSFEFDFITKPNYYTRILKDRNISVCVMVCLKKKKLIFVTLYTGN